MTTKKYGPAETVCDYIWNVGNGSSICFDGITYTRDEIRENWDLADRIYGRLFGRGSSPRGASH